MNDIDYLLALTRIDEVTTLLLQKLPKKWVQKNNLSFEIQSTPKDAATPEDFNINHIVFPEKAAQKEIESLIRQSSAVEIKNSLIEK